MSYLITQTFILLLIAALLGLLLGWYLTRISAASARTSLQARLRSAETRAREIQGELDAALVARDNNENQRRGLSDELNTLRAQVDAGGDSTAQQAELSECREALAQAEARAGEVDKLQADLDACRATLDDAAAVAAPAVEQEADSASIATAAAAALSGAQGLMGNAAAPLASAAADRPADDLQQIKGIGPKIAGILRDLGIQQFDQIAAWTPENVEWVNDQLKFKGRIEREKWIPQAKAFIEARD